MEKNLVCMEENVQKDGTVSFVTAQRQVSLVQRVEGVSLSHIFERELSLLSRAPSSHWLRGDSYGENKQL